MAQATSSRGGSSKTQVQVESHDSPDSESAKNHPEVTKGTESQIGNAESSSREKRRHRASLARHSRKCSVCHHKDREFIDADYLRWISPETIARQYKISHHSVVYRHADATGLRTQRRAALRATLEHFIEQAENVRVTAHSIVSAVRLYSQINDQGQYTPTPRRHIVEHHYFNSPAEASTAAEAAAANTRASATPAAADSQAAIKKNDGSPSNTFAANSAAPLSERKNEFGAVGPTPKVTGTFPPVATTIAGCAMPPGESPEQFPAGTQAATAASGNPARTASSPVSNAAASQAATSAATSAAPLSESKNEFAAVSAASGMASGSASAASATPAATTAGAKRAASAPTQGAPTAAKLESSDGLQPNTFAATSAAPFGESPEYFPAVPVARANAAGSAAAVVSNAAASQAATKTNDGSPSNTFAAPCAAPLVNGSVLMSNAADAGPAATSAATSAAPLSESPQKFPAVPVASAKGAGPAASVLSNAAASQAATSAGHSAALPAEAQRNYDPVKKTGIPPPATTAATSAAHPAKAPINSDPLQTTGSSSPVATTIAGSAMPLSESPEQFPAVSVAPAPAAAKNKTTATPIATIYLQTNAISNRELLGLEHAATH